MGMGGPKEHSRRAHEQTGERKATAATGASAGGGAIGHDDIAGVCARQLASPPQHRRHPGTAAAPAAIFASASALTCLALRSSSSVRMKSPQSITRATFATSP